MKTHLLDELKPKFIFIKNIRYNNEWRIWARASKNHKQYIFNDDGYGGLVFDKKATKDIRLKSQLTENEELLNSVKGNNAELIKIDSAKRCLAFGADVNAKNQFGETALFESVLNENVELTKLLIDNGADVNAKNNSGNTPLMLIATQYTTSQNKIGIAKLLIERGADIYIKDNSGKAVFDIAKTEEMKAVFKKAIQKTFEKTKTKEKKKSKSNDFNISM